MKKTTITKKNPHSSNPATSCQVVSHGNTDSCQLCSENFFPEMIPLVPVLLFNSAGDPLCPVLVTGDSFDMVRHTEEGTWDGFDPQVSVLASNNTKDSILGKQLLYFFDGERKEKDLCDG